MSANLHSVGRQLLQLHTDLSLPIDGDGASMRDDGDDWPLQRLQPHDTTSSCLWLLLRLLQQRPRQQHYPIRSKQPLYEDLLAWLNQLHRHSFGHSKSFVAVDWPLPKLAN